MSEKKRRAKLNTMIEYASEFTGPTPKIKVKKKKKLPYSPPKGSGTQTVTKGDSYKDYPESTNPDLKGGYKSKTRTVIKDGKKVKEKYLVPHKPPLKFKMKKKK